MTEEKKQPKPKRRWLRFNLRTILIVLSILCAWLGWYSYQVGQQRVAVKWVQANGGTLLYDYEFDGQTSIDDGQPSVPKWLLDMLGVDYFATVTRVFVVKAEFSDVTPLATFQNLKSLSLAASTQVSDATPLAGLTNLEVLSLFQTQVSDVTPLAGLTNLETLNLSDTQVNDVTPLASLTNLETLNLSDTQVNDVSPLTGLTNLEILNLSDTQVSDVTPLAGLTNLEYLSIDDTQISDVTPLATLKNLKMLSLTNTQVSDEQIEKLKQALPNCDIVLQMQD